jgi:hypothetical protein
MRGGGERGRGGRQEGRKAGNVYLMTKISLFWSESEPRLLYWRVSRITFSFSLPGAQVST